MSIIKSFLLLVILFGSLGIQSIVIADYFIRYDYYNNVLCVNKENKSLKCNGKCQIEGFLEIKKDSNGKPVLPPFQFKYNALAPEFSEKEYNSPFNLKAAGTISYINNLKDYLVVNSNYPPPKPLLFLA